jgi:diadenylate cyclase
MGMIVALEVGPRGQLIDYLGLMAPGTPLRDGLERILRGRTGALVVMGNTREVQQISTGGFHLDVPYSPTALRELAKMDGAIILASDGSRIVAAGVHLMPDPSIDTVETGTRHRTADRVSRQTGVPVVSVSSSMSTISLYLDRHRHMVEHSDQILSRANQALQTLERYRARLWEVTNRLSALEVQDQVTVRDFALVAQRIEMVRRLEIELSGYVVELGTDGRLLTLQLHELGAGVDELRELLERDYRPQDPAVPFGFAGLAALSTTDLLDPLSVVRAVGFASNDHLDSRITTRGYRQMAQINRLPQAFGVRLIEHFGSLQALFAASSAELQEVDGVGESRARIIRDGLVRLAESAYTERMG